MMHTKSRSPLPDIDVSRLTAGHVLAWAAFTTRSTARSSFFRGNTSGKYILADILVQ